MYEKGRDHEIGVLLVMVIVSERQLTKKGKNVRPSGELEKFKPR